MNLPRNLPIYIRYEEDGTVWARCPMLPNYECKATSRARAIRAMQLLLEEAKLTSSVSKSRNCEIVYLTVESTPAVHHAAPVRPSTCSDPESNDAARSLRWRRLQDARNECRGAVRQMESFMKEHAAGEIPKEGGGARPPSGVQRAARASVPPPRECADTDSFYEWLTRDASSGR